MFLGLWNFCSYVFGGKAKEEKNQLLEYSFKSGEWNQLNALDENAPLARQFHSSVVIGNSM